MAAENASTRGPDFGLIRPPGLLPLPEKSIFRVKVAAPSLPSRLPSALNSVSILVDVLHRDFGPSTVNVTNELIAFLDPHVAVFMHVNGVQPSSGPASLCASWGIALAPLPMGNHREWNGRVQSEFVRSLKARHV
jgi:hypothetical protein